MDKKLTLIGLDGVAWRVLDKMIEQGVTPNLEKIKKEGSWGELTSTIPPLTPAAWTSIQTGVNPGKHGVFSFRGPRKKKRKGIPRGEPTTVTASHIKSKTFPEYLEENDLRAVLINLPLSHPPKTDFPTIGSMFSNKLAYPKRLKDEYDFSDYQISPERSSATDVVSNLKNIHRNIEKNLPVVKELYNKEEWDLFFYLFSHTDWGLHNAGEEFFHDEENKKVKWLKKIYSSIDEEMGWFMKQLDEDNNLVIMSDHGFDYYDHQVSPAGRLMEEDLIKARLKKISWDGNSSIKDNLASFIFRIGLRSGYISNKLEFRYPWYCNKNREMIKEESNILTGDPKFPTFFINDERFYGRVGNPERIRKMLEEVIKEYNEEINVFRKEDIYWGDALSAGPEIITMPKKGLPKMFLISREKMTGEFQHSMDGIVLGYGPDMSDKEMKDHTLYDITPTILHYFDIPLSKNFDGKVMRDIFKRNSDIDREPRYEEREEEKTIDKVAKDIEI